MPAKAGIHGGKKTQVPHEVGMGSRLRGNDAAVLLLTPYVQQSGTIAGLCPSYGTRLRGHDAAVPISTG